MACGARCTCVCVCVCVGVYTMMHGGMCVRAHLDWMFINTTHSENSQQTQHNLNSDCSASLFVCGVFVKCVCEVRCVCEL